MKLRITVIMASILLGAACAESRLNRLLVVVGLIALSVPFIAKLRPAVTVIALLVWLPFLGLVRRLFPPLATSPLGDPLLVIAPACVLSLFLFAPRRAKTGHTDLGTAVIWFVCLIAVSGINPLQGSLAAGAIGVSYLVAPILWFFVGRAYLDGASILRVLTVVVGVGISSAIYGIYQVQVGFPHFDAQWVESRGYEALNVGGVIRPFATFVAASDFSLYVGAALALLVTMPSAMRWSYRLGGASVLLVALVLSAARGAMVTTLLGIVVVGCARRRVTATTAAVSGVVALVTASVLLSLVQTSFFDDQETGGLVRHQIEGLGSPLTGDSSTARSHVSLVVEGLKSIGRHPLGVGPASVAVGGERFGAETRGTEADFGNVSVALGLPGLALFTYIVVRGLYLAYLAARERAVGGPLVLAVLMVTFMQWLNGGHYATAPLAWLALGYLEQLRLARRKVSMHCGGHIPDRGPIAAKLVPT